MSKIKVAMRILKFLFNLIPGGTAYAHCDIPCGIYDPHAAQLAAKTILKMVQKINEEPLPENGRPEVIKESVVRYENAVGRYVFTKEAHAEICKKEILILWTDY